MEGFGLLVWFFYLVLFLIVGGITFALVYLGMMFFVLGKQKKAETSNLAKASILLKVLLISLPITGLILFLIIKLSA